MPTEPDEMCNSCYPPHRFRFHWETERNDYKGCMMAGCACTKFVKVPEVEPNAG